MTNGARVGGEQRVMPQPVGGQAAAPTTAGLLGAAGVEPTTTGRLCSVVVDRAWSATVAAWGPLGTSDARHLGDVALGLVEGRHALGVEVDLRHAEVEDDDTLAAVLAAVVAAARRRGVPLSVIGPASGPYQGRWFLEHSIDDGSPRGWATSAVASPQEVDWE